jgi:3-oxoacyl-[acyl-carrier protein] reductase
VDLGLRGKVALVAGSSQGLGRAIAEELAAEGCALTLCARGAGPLEEAREAIASQFGVRVTAVAADLARSDEARGVAASAIREHGRVDILVTNAGGPPSGPFESHDEAAWLATVRLTLLSVVEMARAVLPGMKERRFGRILNVTSIAAKQPVDGLILSNAVRAAVTGMARTLANETAPFGITVNNLMPGYTRTERLQELVDAIMTRESTTPDAVTARWKKEIPAGRLGEPRELAALAAFLASDRAAYITGQSIAVDGGWIRGIL